MCYKQTELLLLAEVSKIDHISYVRQIYAKSIQQNQKTRMAWEGRMGSKSPKLYTTEMIVNEEDYIGLIQPYFDHCSPLWDNVVPKQLKDKLQKLQNSAGKVITGSSYDVRSADVLNNLEWKTLETRCFLTKATLMYKILNMYLPPN